MEKQTTTQDAALAAAEELAHAIHHSHHDRPSERTLRGMIESVIRRHMTQTPPVAPESLEFAGHTPGPWGHDCAGYVSGGDANGWIATVHFGCLSVGKDEWTANQNLIAAAPALLAERDALREGLESSYQNVMELKCYLSNAKKRIVEIAADNARLREAMVKIANYSMRNLKPGQKIADMAEFARAALSKTT